GPDHRAAARAVPHGARGRVPRPPQPVRERVLRAGPGVLLPADRRSGRVAADDLAGAGGPPPATSGVPGLLRRLLAVRPPGCGARRPGPAQEALGGREGRTYWRRVITSDEESSRAGPRPGYSRRPRAPRRPARGKSEPEVRPVPDGLPDQQAVAVSGPLM